VVDEETPLPTFRETQRTETVRQRKEQNLLIVHTQPQPEAHFWALGAALTTVDGKTMTDLVYH